MNWNLKNNPITKVRFNAPKLEVDPETQAYTLAHKLSVQVAEATETAIVNAIVDAAKEAGVTDLYLIDKEFILSAIQHEMERRGLR